jgi:HK97 gp10 family phage protein
MASRLVLDLGALRSLLRTPEATRQAMDAGNEFADTARKYAAKHTGAGARSIHPIEQDPGTVGVSWDLDHRYMRFQEWGTEIMPAHPALTPALAEYPEF